MAHGAGGKATQTLIEGLLVPAFGSARSTALGDAGASRRRRRPRADDRQLRRQADPLPGRLDRRAGRQRHRQRPRRGGRAAARAERCRWSSRRASTADVLRAEVEAIAARRARRPASRSSPATRRSSSAATPTAMYVCTTGHRPASTRARALSPARAAAGRPDPRLRLDRRARHGDHARARRVRARRRRSSPTRARCGRPSTRCSTPPGPALRCMRDATRGGVASVLNELARASGVAMLVREAAVPVEPGGRGRGRAARHRPDVRRQRGQARRVRRARGAPTRRSPRCARCPAASRRPRSARCGPSRPAWCWWRPRSAAGG